MDNITANAISTEVQQGLVSVVVTCYNYGKYLSDCLQSVLSQSYQNLEIVVVNDGSTDDTDEVVAAYTSLPNFKYIKQSNKGQANAKNNGIQHCSGEFIAFLDADDCWHPEKIEKQMPLFADSKVGVAYSLASYIDTQGIRLDYVRESEYLQPRRGWVSHWLVYDNFVEFSSAVVRRRCFDHSGAFDESLTMGIDWDLWLRISTSYCFDYVPERLFQYRMGHSGQMSKNLVERQRCSDQIMKNFLSRFPDVVSEDIIRKATSVSFCNRGEYYREIAPFRSYRYFLKALRLNVSEIRAYKGLAKNIVFLLNKKG